MDAKELMIGDWVNVPKLNKPVRVNAVYRTMIKPNPDDDDVHASIGDEYLEPIPLTEEILEANGFVVSDEKAVIPDVGVVIIYGKYRRLDEDNMLNMGDNLYPIRYVHELQHVLRLCGIDKEIKLEE